MKRVNFPLTVSEGALSVKIYKVRARSTGYSFFQLCYSLAGQRVRKSLADLEDAKQEAHLALARIATGKATVTAMGNTDRESFAESKRLLREMDGKPVHISVAEYVDAARLLPQGATLREAAREYAARHGQQMKPKMLAEVVEEFLDRKTKDGASVRYIQSLRSALRRLAGAFRKPISSIGTQDLERWLDTHVATGRTRNNLRLSIVTLWRWARAQGYIARDVETEADRIGTAKDRGGKIGVLSPAQLTLLLLGGRDSSGEEATPTPEAELFIGLGAFTGIRAAELLRLEWSDIDEPRGVIVVGAHKSKTATRRLVPIHDALARWLARATRGTGKVFSSVKAAVRVIGYGKQMLGAWPDNALRHSYATYRLAQTHDAARVALEMGNSPTMLFRNYRELADESQAQGWFAITPPQPSTWFKSEARHERRRNRCRSRLELVRRP